MEVEKTKKISVNPLLEAVRQGQNEEGNSPGEIAEMLKKNCYG